jgi:hypothetical protein
MTHRPLALLASALLFLAAAAGAEEAPQLKGRWTLNRALSQDIEARMKESAGSQYMTGSGPGWKPPETWLPIGVKFDEAERLEVRKFLLAVIPSLQHLEIEMSAAEIKTIHGEGGARIFSLVRKSAGTSALTGERVTRSATLEGRKLTLESKGKDSVLIETLTATSESKQLVYSLHFEAKILEKPLDLNLVYEPAK